MRHVIVCAALAGLVLTGCSSGGSYQAPTEERVVPLPDTGVLDLATGRFTPNTTSASGAQAAFKLLRAAGTVTSGDALMAAGPVTTTVGSRSAGPILMGTTELSRAQWVALGGSTPWNVLTTELRGPNSDATAATNLSWDAVNGALIAWNAAHAPYRLRLPTPAEWEIACRAGSSSEYAWGAAYAAGSSTAAIATLARVRETLPLDNRNGPVAVTANDANALGFRNMHGNVWEWVQEAGDTTGVTAHLRGGSWHDEAVRAQAGNRLAMPLSVSYGTAGVRLVLEVP